MSASQRRKGNQCMTDQRPTLRERFVLDDQAPNNAVYGPVERYGVWDNAEGRYAMLPNAKLCWGLPYDEALDSLLELRTGLIAQTMRTDES